MRPDRDARQILEPPLLVFFAGERLDHGDAGERLMNVRLDLALDVAAGVRRLAERPAE
jgi:hypothetical protein